MAQKDVGNKIPIYKLKTTDEVMKYYDEWGDKDKYNKDMVDWNYTGPKETAETFNKHEKNKDTLIFDAGCGTGLVGLELKKYSFKNFHGAGVGTFTFGHVKPNALDEFIRITKPGGLICFTINEGIHEEYGFDKKIDFLKQNNKWEEVEFFKSDYIASKDVNAWLGIYKVTT